MGINCNELGNLFANDDFIISNHARVRMFERNISTEDIKNVIIHGEIIQHYPDDEPCPAALFLGFPKGKACHVVVAECDDHARIITVYSPEKNKWIDYRIRNDKL